MKTIGSQAKSRPGGVGELFDPLRAQFDAITQSRRSDRGRGMRSGPRF